MLQFILNWIWPRDRCHSRNSITEGSISEWRTAYLPPELNGKSLGRISRAPDGRFVLRDSTTGSRAGSLSNYSSSDDGGFLPRRGRNRASWRRPLVGYPSQLSLRSDGSGQSARAGLSNFLGQFGGLLQPRLALPVKPVVAVYSLQGPTTPTSPRFQSSSPAASSNVLLSPWSPVYFSDLSSVRQTSSGDRSFPTPPGFVQLKSVHERYSQELPSLRAIHEESYNHGFIPVHPIRLPSNRPRARLLPRHNRIARSAPELASPEQAENSPGSRSSSSGFGSKNTSQQNQSSRSGSSFADWRLPPYRPPPPPPAVIHQLPPPPPIVGHWLELTSRLHDASPLHHKSVDVGSVDGHYEFDPSTPTPTPSTPTGPRDDSKPLGLTLRRYDNIEARVQAMKEEFHEFRKRQAKRRRSHELESVC